MILTQEITIRAIIGIVSFFAGIFVGVITTLFYKKEKLSFEKMIAIVISSVWLGFHVVGFMKDKSVPYLFDVIGCGAVGLLMGMKLEGFLEKITIFKK